MLDAGQTDNLCHFAVPKDAHACITALAQFIKAFVGAFPHAAVQVKGRADVINGQAGTQCDALGRDDIAQFLALGAFDLHIAFGYQPFEVPVDGANGNAQFIRQTGLRDVGVCFDLGQEIQRAAVLFGGQFGFHIFQLLNYRRLLWGVKSHERAGAGRIGIVIVWSRSKSCCEIVASVGGKPLICTAELYCCCWNTLRLRRKKQDPSQAQDDRGFGWMRSGRQQVRICLSTRQLFFGGVIDLFYARKIKILRKLRMTVDLDGC